MKMQNDLEKIKRSLDENLPFIEKNFNVGRIGIFGSVVRGDNTEKSDVDLLVELSEPIGLFKFLELEDFLSQTVGKKVDLVSKGALKEVIREDILQNTVYV